jgi:hypothetical protein
MFRKFGYDGTVVSMTHFSRGMFNVSNVDIWNMLLLMDFKTDIQLSIWSMQTWIVKVEMQTPQAHIYETRTHNKKPYIDNTTWHCYVNYTLYGFILLLSAQIQL